MFTQTTRFYDAVYAAIGKDYARETEALVARARASIDGPETLLDVACGTGAHLARFAAHGFAVRGIDLDVRMVALARARLPDVNVEPADMRDFALPERFDVVTCLFGSAAYARTPERLRAAVASMARHLTPRGVLFVEPFFPPEVWQPGRTSAVYVDEPDLKLARMNVARQVGDLAILDFHYLTATRADGVERFFERHELGLFRESDYRGAFAAAGLAFDAPEEPAFPRGLYVGTRTP